MATADEFDCFMPKIKNGSYECPWEKWKRPGAYNLLKWKLHTTDNSRVPKEQVNLSISHYVNMPMQYTAIFHGCKNGNFHMKKFNIFLIFAQNIDCGYQMRLF